MTPDVQRERETTIAFDDTGSPAKVWSASPRFKRTMDKLGCIPLRSGDTEHGGQCWWWEVPRDWVRVQRPRVWSDASRALMAAHARRRFAAKGDRS